MHLQMIATDLDGTLMSEDHMRVSDENKQYLLKAKEQGAGIVLASGRSYEGIKPVLEQIPFVDYLILSNGAAILDVKTKERIYSEDLPYQIWENIVDIIKEHGLLFEIYAEGIAYMEKQYFKDYDNPAFSEEFLNQLKQILKPIDEAKVELKSRSVEKICTMATSGSNPEGIRQELDKIEEIYITSSLPGNMEINKKGTNKGAALAYLCQYLGIEKEHVAAFGDAMNDLEMIQYAGHSFAMGNACEQVKTAAKNVTAENGANGVAKGIEKLLLEIERANIDK